MTSTEPVSILLMSSRFSTIPFNRSDSSSMVCNKDSGLLGTEGETIGQKT